MKKSDSIIIINDNLAEAINLVHCEKFNSINNENFLNCGIQMPKIIISNANDIRNVLNGGNFSTATFNNLIANEKKFVSGFIKTKYDPSFENRLVTEITNSYNFDFLKKIDTFICNSAEKIIDIFEKQYKTVIHSPDNTMQVEMLSQKFNVSTTKIKWLFNKIKDIRAQKVMFAVDDIYDETPGNQSKLVIKMINPEFNKMFTIMNKLISFDLFDMENYFDYFKNIFDSLCLQISDIENDSEDSAEKIRMYITYFKLLAMRTYDCFGVFKFLTIDIVNMDKMCLLLSNMEEVIAYLEDLL